jgi:hypothetical protein
VDTIKRTAPKLPDHEAIRLDAAAHPKRNYREHVEAAAEIAAAEYRAEIRAMTKAGTLDPESDEL